MKRINLTEDIEQRAIKIFRFLQDKQEWLSAKQINIEFKYVHSTLWKTLRLLQAEGLVISCRSLADTRVTMYRIAPDLPGQLTETGRTLLQAISMS